MYWVVEQEPGDSVNVCPLTGYLEVNNDVSNYLEISYGMQLGTSQRHGWEEISKWVLGEVRETSLIMVQ